MITKTRLWGLQLLFGWMNLVLAVPSIYLMLGMPLVMRQHGWTGTEIGLFQLAALPVIFKFILAMPVQRVRLGGGHFVHWLWLLGLLLLALYVGIGRQNLIEHRLPLFALTFAISIAVTWMDIPLNALAVQWLPRVEQLRAGSIRSAALFVGAVVGGGAMLIVQARWGWQAPFVIMAMGLLEAMQRGSGERYFQEDQIQAKKLVPEGIAARVPYKGQLADVVYQLTGGIRSGMGYCGCAQIEELHEIQFTRISTAGVRENHPHDVQITSEAPNYSMKQG